MSSPEFQRNLAFGQVAEGIIARWLMARGNRFLPIYDIEYETGKGPRLFGNESGLVAPDGLVFSADHRIFWAECKRKSCFAWCRKTQHWVTGIDMRHWLDYKRVAAETAIPIWLFFLHESTRPDTRDIAHGCPRECPAGLFGEEMQMLAGNIDNESGPRIGTTGWGRSGMVYWAHGTLRRLAGIEELRPHLVRGTS